MFDNEIMCSDKNLCVLLSWKMNNNSNISCSVTTICVFMKPYLCYFLKRWTITWLQSNLIRSGRIWLDLIRSDLIRSNNLIWYNAISWMPCDKMQSNRMPCDPIQSDQTCSGSIWPDLILSHPIWFQSLTIFSIKN